MKKHYKAPIVEKVSFDYKVQMQANSIPVKCFGSVINVSEGVEQCVSGTPFYFGWNNPNPSEIH